MPCSRSPVWALSEGLEEMGRSSECSCCYPNRTLSVAEKRLSVNDCQQEVKANIRRRRFRAWRQLFSCMVRFSVFLFGAD